MMVQLNWSFMVETDIYTIDDGQPQVKALTVYVQGEEIIALGPYKNIKSVIAAAPKLFHDKSENDTVNAWHACMCLQLANYKVSSKIYNSSYMYKSIMMTQLQKTLGTKQLVKNMMKKEFTDLIFAYLNSLSK